MSAQPSLTDVAHELFLKSVRRLLHEREETQEQLAEALGCSPGHLSRLLQDRRRAVCQKIADHLAFDLEEVIAQSERNVDALLVGFCPNPRCPLATAIITYIGLQIIPKFHRQPVRYCPFCPWQPLTRQCPCGSGISPAGANCVDCGRPHIYVTTMTVPADEKQLPEFVQRFNSEREAARRLWPADTE